MTCTRAYNSVKVCEHATWLKLYGLLKLFSLEKEGMNHVEGR